ncbi:MAG: FFLEELY motif protein, partial [Bacteroidota bacterium]
MADAASESAPSAPRLRDEVARVRELRDAARSDPVLGQDRLLVRAWQADRLARTYPDLLANPRYGDAAAFFLSDLYGPKDFSARDEALARIIPTLTRLLPAAAIETIGLAVELDALSEALDQRVAAALRRRQPGARALELSEGSYAEAYRAAGSSAERERQIWLVGRIGAALDKLARKPLIAGALRVMEAPARAA